MRALTTYETERLQNEHSAHEIGTDGRKKFAHGMSFLVRLNHQYNLAEVLTSWLDAEECTPIELLDKLALSGVVSEEDFNLLCAGKAVLGRNLERYLFCNLPFNICWPRKFLQLSKNAEKHILQDNNNKFQPKKVEVTDQEFAELPEPNALSLKLYKNYEETPAVLIAYGKFEREEFPTKFVTLLEEKIDAIVAYADNGKTKEDFEKGLADFLGIQVISLYGFYPTIGKISNYIPHDHIARQVADLLAPEDEEFLQGYLPEVLQVSRSPTILHISTSPPRAGRSTL